MLNFFKTHHLLLAGLLAIIASRFFFLPLGYGIDGEGYTIIQAAHIMTKFHIYEASRLPGYPILEFVYLFFWKSPYLLVNSITFLFTLLSFFFWSKNMKLLSIKAPMLTAISLFFVPTLFIESTRLIDSLWGFCFVGTSLYFLLKNKPSLSGVLLGIAIGCRITNGAMLLPFLILIFFHQRPLFFKHSFKLITFMGIIGGLCYLPAFCRYGPGFFLSPKAPVTLLGVGYVFVKLWGPLFSLAIPLALIAMAYSALKNKETIWSDSIKKGSILASISVLILYTFAFLCFPVNPRYLIPIVPFLLILFSFFLPAKPYKCLLVLIFISLYVGDLRVKNKHVNFTLIGAGINNYTMRHQLMPWIEQTRLFVNTLPKNAVVLAGWAAPYLNTPLEGQFLNPHIAIYTPISKTNLEALIHAGKKIVAVGNVREDTRCIHGYDIHDLGIQETRPLPKGIFNSD